MGGVGGGLGSGFGVGLGVRLRGKGVIFGVFFPKKPDLGFLKIYFSVLVLVLVFCIDASLGVG